MEDASWETRRCQWEEGRRDLKKYPRGIDIQKAKITSKHGWRHINRALIEQGEREGRIKGEVKTGLRGDKMCP